MSESFHGRREVAASEFEKTAEFKARERLAEIGVFQKVSDLDLYHGRTGDGSGNWEVQPDFNNAGDNTGNLNINQKPALNTGSYETARDFSEARARRKGGVAEVHKIESADPDAMIIDLSSFSRLTANERAEVDQLMQSISPTPIAGAPLSFEDRDSINKTRGPGAFMNQYGLMFKNEVSSIAQQYGIRSRTVEHVGSAINTHSLIGRGFLKEICYAFSDDEPSIYLRDNKKNEHEVPINHEYFTNWLRANHVVGCKMGVHSATLGKKIDNYLLFDLEKINTPEKNEQLNKERNRRFGRVARAMGEKLRDRRTEVVKLLTENLYAKPEEIVEAAKKTPGFEKIFDEDAGNWEGYKLGEHTETVLRLFDDNYADAMPADTLPIMRLALLTHDIGKGEAAKKHDKGRQDLYNVVYAENFMRLNGVDEDTRGLVTAMISRGKNLMSDYKLKGDKDPQLKDKLRKDINRFCADCLEQYLGIEPDGATVTGMKTMLEVLQTCDSAAYTTMGVTRSKRGNGIISYRNAGSFNGSFHPFHGFTGRRVRMK